MKSWLRISLQALTLALVGLVAAVALFTGAYFYIEPGLPEADELRNYQVQIPLRINSSDGRLMQQYGEQKRSPTGLEDIPVSLQNAVIAAEDDAFYRHAGIDVLSTVRAVVNYGISFVFRREGRVAGGSTITQQITRTTDLLSRNYDPSRKLKEIFLAFRIEREFTKDEILELYLNTYFFGQRSYGVASAAQSYFNKTLDELSLSEVAIIAGIPTRPSSNNPYTSPENADRRRRYVLRRMFELGFIDQAEREAALAEPIVSQLFDPVVEVEAGYVAAEAYAWCQDRYGKEACDTGGLTITTTVDSRLQRAANKALRDTLEAYDRNHGYRGPLGRIDLEALGLAGSDDDVADEDASPAAALDTVLSDYPPAFGAEAAVVLAVGDTYANLYLRNHGVVSIGFDAVSWAREFYTDDSQGPYPDVAGDVLAPGHIVRLKRNAEGSLELTQVPDDQASFVQGALVSVDPANGAVNALVGGYGFEHSEFNRATQGQRQPGSSFKPFFYLSALANGYTLSSVINDAPTTYYDPTLERTITVRNFTPDFNGPTRLREVLIQSLNASANRVILRIGASTAADYIERFGFDIEERERNASLALGGLTVTPLELASAYAILANGGYAVGIPDPVTGRVGPYIVQSVRASDGNLLYDYDARVDVLTVCREDAETADAGKGEVESGRGLFARFAAVVASLNCAERVESAQRIYLISDVMRDIVTRGSGAAAGRAFRGERSDLSGKTGTTTGPRDAWFAGFNADVVTVVRVGFDDDQRPLGRREQGGVTAIPAWIDFMKVALAGRPDHVLPQPPGIIRRRIDPDSGLIASDCNSDAIWEYFLLENQPEREPDGGCRAVNPLLPAEPGDPDSRSDRTDIFN